MNFKRTRVAATMAATTTALIGIGGPAASAASAATNDAVTPDINRVNCFTAGNPLYVWQSYGANADCFENAGLAGVKIYNFDSVYTGNNGTYFILDYGGHTYGCGQPFKNSWVTASSCGVPYAKATMAILSIYPGI